MLGLVRVLTATVEAQLAQAALLAKVLAAQMIPAVEFPESPPVERAVPGRRGER